MCHSPPYLEPGPPFDPHTVAAVTALAVGVCQGEPYAGSRGIDEGARAASLNIVAAGASASGFLTAIPCGQPSNVSNLNFAGGGGATANGTNVKLDGSGAVCVTASTPTHVIVDITGIWS